MDIDAALNLARKVVETGERAEIVPTKDGAEVYILKRWPLLFFYRKENHRC